MRVCFKNAKTGSQHFVLDITGTYSRFAVATVDIFPESRKLERASHKVHRSSNDEKTGGDRNVHTKGTNSSATQGGSADTSTISPS